MATATKLGKSAPKSDDAANLGGLAESAANIGIGTGFPGAGMPLGFLAHAIMGTTPSDAAIKGAMTMGLSNLSGLFDRLESMGFSRVDPNMGPLGAIRPDIGDLATQRALGEQVINQDARAMVARTASETAAVDAADLARRGPVADMPQPAEIGNPFGSFNPATQTPAPGPAPEPATPSEAAPTAEGAPGATGAGTGPGPEGGQYYDGGVFFITPDRLKEPDPPGPDKGKIEINAKPGEAVMVFPEDMVKRYGMDKIKAFFNSWKAHSRMKDTMMPQGMMPRVKRKTAMM